MIKRIQYQNVKGNSGDHQLKPLNFITGPNFSGKTTITDAIRLAMLGHLPGLPKTAAGTFALSSGNLMRVELDYGTGTIARQWKAAGKGIKLDTVHNGDSDTLTLDDFAQMLNVFAFISASPRARIQILVDAGISDGETDFEAMIAKAEALEEKARDHRAEAGQWGKTAAGLSQLITAGTRPATPPPMPDFAAAIAKSTAAQDRLRGLEDAAELAAGITIEPVEPPTADEIAASMAAMEEKCTAAQKIQFEVGKARNALRALSVPVEVLTDEQETAVRAKMEAARELAETPDFAPFQTDELAVAKDAHARAVKALETLPTLTECPFCRCTGDGWQAQVTRSAEQQRDAAAETIARITAAHEDKAAQIEARKVYANGAAMLEMNANARQWIAKRDEMQRTLEELTATAAAATNDYEAALAEFRRLQGKVHIARNQEHNRRILENAPTPDQLQEAAAAAAAAENEEDALREEVATITAQADALRNWLRRESDLTEALAKQASAAENAEKAAGTAKELRDQAKQAMDALFSGILTVAGPLSRNVLGNALSMSPSGEIGVQGNLGFRPFATLSGTEQVIAEICIQAGLTARAGGILIVDELSRLDAGRKPELLRELAALVDHGVISQVVVVDHDTDAARMAAEMGYNVILAGNQPPAWFGRNMAAAMAEEESHVFKQ